MMPNISKGNGITGLLRYLVGPGQDNEHTNPTVIAGDFVVQHVFGGRVLEEARALELGRLLDTPRQVLLRGEPVNETSYKKARALEAEGLDRRAALAAATKDHNVWHCSLTLAPAEPALHAPMWKAIAEDFMEEMGFIARADDAPDMRWAAVHHGPNKGGGDHIHIVMSVVRSDRALADRFQDYARAQTACNALERRYHLSVLGSRERRAGSHDASPVSHCALLRQKVQVAAASAKDETAFVQGLRAQGLQVRARYRREDSKAVAEYSIREPRSSIEKVCEPAWYRGAQLSKDLTLVALRRRHGWRPEYGVWATTT